MNTSIVNIIFISSEWKNYHRREFTEEICKKISIWSDVLLVQLPVSLLVHLVTNFKDKILGLFLRKYKTVKLSDRVFLFTPVILFHYLLWLKFKPFAYIDSFLLKIQINNFIKRKFEANFRILWLYFPQLYPITDIISYNYLIYDYYDNYEYDYFGDIIIRDSNFNKKLIKKSDFVICTSKKLLERSKTYNESSYYIPNGNSFEKINHADRNFDFIKKRKTVGYLGTYRNWVDFELVESLISKFHDYDFLFVGGIHPTGIDSFKKLKENKNFFYIPSQPFEIAVKYLKAFDVGIIPFRINKFTEGVFPNKFFEYMAAGIPVVTTALPDLGEFSNIIGFSRTHREFTDNVQKALNGYFDNKIITYKELAKRNSWEKRVEYLNKILKEKLNINYG